MTTPRELSHQLREVHTEDLSRRRLVVGLSLLGAAMGQIVSLYQMGIIKKLPDPPFEIFDSSKVDAADYAYSRMQTPDAVAMIVNYGITAWLAAAGDKDRAKNAPWIPLALAAKTIVDAGTALELGREEYAQTKKLCFYCQVATVVSLASVVVALPEARKAWSAWRSR